MAYSTQDPYADNGKPKSGMVHNVLGIFNPLQDPWMWSIRNADVRIPRIFRPSYRNNAFKPGGAWERLTDVWTTGKLGGRQVGLGRKLTHTAWQGVRSLKPTWGINDMTSSRRMLDMVSRGGVKEGLLNSVMSNEQISKLAQKRGMDFAYSSAAEERVEALHQMVWRVRGKPALDAFNDTLRTEVRSSIGKRYAMGIEKKLLNNKENLLRKIAEMTPGIGKGWRRTAVIAGKGASIIGLAALMWQVLTPVANMAGRNIIANINQGLSAYGQRYMPSMTKSQLQAGFLSSGAATERQRSIEAISKASINGRSAFGNESMYMHQ